MEKKVICLVVRHGETEANANNQFRSRLDTALDEEGIKQAEKAAGYIKDNYKVRKIVASPLLRAVQTADIISESVSAPVTQDRGLISWHLGFLTGKDKDLFEPVLGIYIDNPKEEIPDGESLDAFEQRGEDFFDKEFHDKAVKENDVAVYVTHSSNIICLENLVQGNRDGRPETGQASVEPGGIVAVWMTDSGYEVEPVFGNKKEAEFGS